MPHNAAVSLNSMLAKFSEHWAPKKIAEINDCGAASGLCVLVSGGSDDGWRGDGGSAGAVV